MAFLTALGSALGGYATGHAQRVADKLAQQQQEESERVGAANAAAQGIDINTGRPMPLPPLPVNLTQVRPHNQGRGAPATPDEQNDLRWQQAMYYASQPDAESQAVGKSMVDALTAQGLYGYRGAETQYTLQGRLPQAEAQTEFIRTAHQTAIEIANSRDAAAYQRAVLAAQTQLRDHYTDSNTRLAVAQIAGQYMLQGKTLQEATAMADATYQSQIQATMYGTGTGWQQVPTPQPMSAGPSTIIYIDPSTGQQRQLQAPGVPGGGGGGGGAADVSPYVQAMRTAIKQNRVQEFMQGLQQSVQAGNITSAQALQIIREGALPPGLESLSGAGGSNVNANPPPGYSPH